MRFSLRTLLIASTICLVSGVNAEDISRDVMRLLLSNADLVVLGELTVDSYNGLVREGGTHVSWPCKIRVLQIVKGKAPTSEVISANVDIVTDHPFSPPKKGKKQVFFLKADGNYWTTADDLYFCVQPASIVSGLVPLAEQMRKH